jgi:glycosyltransferase involved in cell wall biosynthesis
MNLKLTSKYLITICVCTYNRNAGLFDLLNSINDSKLPDNIDFSKINIVVVDNFDGKSKDILKNNNFEYNIDWCHETNKGLAYARNRSVKMAKDTEYCFFVDDDQILDKYCIKELLDTANKYNADLVYGSNPPIFKVPPPNSIKVLFIPRFESVKDYEISLAPTNCTLIKKSVLDNFEGPFNLTFNLTGGEDSYLTRQIKLRGFKLFRCINAKAYEITPTDRCSIKWLTKRNFRCSNSLTVQDKLLKLGYAFYVKRIIKAIMKLLCVTIGLPMMLFMPSSSKLKYKFWLESVQGLGHIFGYFNYQFQEYKH